MKSAKNKQSGILLIEVLFSILIFSFGILGLVGLQAVASQNAVGAEDRNIAAALANDIVSQMWLRKTSRLVADAVPQDGADPAGLVTDITKWKTKVAGSKLAGAVGDVSVSSGITTVTITWRPPSRQSAASDNRYTTQVVI